MERLTEYHNGVAVIKDKSRLKEAMERLAEYENTGLTPEKLVGIDEAYTQQAKELAEYKRAEEQGLLLRLPCKVGDTVYSITWWDDKTERIKVKGKIYYRTVREHKVTKEKFSLLQLYKFGEEVFLTKKEAEVKLEELRGGSDG